MGPARRRCGTVVLSRLYLAVYRILALSAVSGTNFRFELRPGQQAASLYALLERLETRAVNVPRDGQREVVRALLLLALLLTFDAPSLIPCSPGLRWTRGVERPGATGAA